MNLHLPYPPTAPASLATMHPHIDLTRAPARSNSDASITPHAEETNHPHLLCGDNTRTLWLITDAKMPAHS